MFFYFYFIFAEALEVVSSCVLDAIELEERIIQAVSDLLELLLFDHHLICKYSQQFIDSRYVVMVYLLMRGVKCTRSSIEEMCV